MVRKAITELYLNVKIRSQEEIAKMNEEAMETEKSKLACIDTLDIIDYIKQSVEILMHMRMDEFELFKNNWNAQEKMRKAQVAHEKEKLKAKIRGEGAAPTEKKRNETRLFEKVKHELMSNQSSLASLDPMGASASQRGFTSSMGKSAHSQAKLDKQALAYEKMLIKLESDIRMHIRVEQQLKLHIEQMQTQTDEIIRDNQHKKAHIQSLTARLHDLEAGLEHAQSGQKELVHALEDQIKQLQQRLHQQERVMNEQMQKKEKFYKAQIQKLQQESKASGSSTHQSQKVTSFQSDKFMGGMGVRSGEQLGGMHNCGPDGSEDNYTYNAAGMPAQKNFSGVAGKISLGATVGTCTLGESTEGGGGLTRYTGVSMGPGLGGKLDGVGQSLGVHHQAPNSATLQKFGRKDKRALNN